MPKAGGVILAVGLILVSSNGTQANGKLNFILIHCPLPVAIEHMYWVDSKNSNSLLIYLPLKVFRSFYYRQLVCFHFVPWAVDTIQFNYANI